MSFCARVLAAALMAVVIAAVIAFPARLGSGAEHGLAIVAPPSTQQRPFHVPALSATRPKAAAIVVRLTRPVVTVSAISHAVVAAAPRPPAKRPATKRPAAVPVSRPVPETRMLAAAPLAPLPAATSAPSPQPSAPTQRGHGHAYGHDRQHGNPHEATSPPAAAPSAPAPADSEQPPSQDTKPEHGHGHAYGHDK